MLWVVKKYGEYVLLLLSPLTSYLTHIVDWCGTLMSLYTESTHSMYTMLQLATGQGSCKQFFKKFHFQ